MNKILYVSPTYITGMNQVEFRTITDAIQSIPQDNKETIKVVIKKGRYEENS